MPSTKRENFLSKESNRIPSVSRFHSKHPTFPYLEMDGAHHIKENRSTHMTFFHSLKVNNLLQVYSLAGSIPKALREH